MKISLALTLMILGAVPVAGRAAASDGSCPECVLGPLTLSVERGEPRAHHAKFEADPAVAYTLVLEQVGAAPAVARIELNGRHVVGFKDAIEGPGTRDTEVEIKRKNHLTIVVKGPRGAALRAALVPTSALPLSRQPCGSRRDFFSFYPFRDPARVIGILPLGNMSAPGHILPSDHIYVHLVADQPGSGTVTSLADFYSGGQFELVAVTWIRSKKNYEIFLQPCREVRVYHSHVHRFDPVIEQALDPAAWICPPEFAGEFCMQRTNLVVTPGQRLGSIVNSILDWGLIDLRRPPLPFANPARYDFSLFQVPPSLALLVPYISSESPHRYCPIDYLAPDLQTAALWTKFGSFDGLQPRTLPPICGDHAQDKIGTAQGNWFGSAQDSQMTENQGALALVHDNVDPTVPIFSVSQVFCQQTPSGQSCAWDTGQRHFAPLPAGSVNRDFADVLPGAVYCYESLKFPPQAPDAQIGVVLLEVFSLVPGGVVDRLRIEPIPLSQASICGAGPWMFSGAAREFQR